MLAAQGEVDMYGKWGISDNDPEINYDVEITS